MKILVNGYTVTEHMQLVRNRKDIDLVNKVIDHIKANKGMYLKLVLFTALLLHFDIMVYANDFNTSIDRVGYQILDMLKTVARWGCLGMGIKEMITNIREFRKVDLIECRFETIEDLTLLDKAIGHLKRNRRKYIIIFLLVMFNRWFNRLNIIYIWV